MKKQGTLAYLTNILVAGVKTMICKPIKWFHELVSEVTGEAERLSYVGSEENLQPIHEDITKKVNDQGNSILYVLGELAHMKNENEKLNE